MTRLALLIALATLVTGPAQAQDQPDPRVEAADMISIDELRRATRQRDRFVQPGPAELTAAGQVLSDLVAGRAPEAEMLRQAGLEPHSGEGFAALADVAGAPAGRGLYVIRPDGAPLMISAPHQFRDLGTGRIAALLAGEQEARAVAFNTAPRDLTVEPDGGLSDLGKLEDTHFNLFHLAVRAAYPDTRIVQLHGFARGKRQTAAARGQDVIVSNATRRPDPGTRAVRSCLVRAGFRAGLYPETVTELGGTRNVTWARLRDAGAPAGTFLHVEISLELRELLADDADLRWVFGACLGAGTGEAG